jgi:charged multivesicular body protein 6
MGGASSKVDGSGATTKKAPGGTISNVDRTILDLKNARDRLKRYKERLELDEQKLVSRAKAAKDAGQTKTALNLLRLRKYKQNEVTAVESQLLNVLQMVQTIDSKQNETQVLDALRVGKETLQKMHEEVTIDDVVRLMDDIAEENEVEREISDILAAVPGLSAEDENAVEAELEALAQEMQTNSMSIPTAPIDVPIPNVPSHKLPEVKDKTEAEQSQDSERVAVSS